MDPQWPLLKLNKSSLSLPLSPSIQERGLCTTLLTFTFPRAMGSGVPPPGFLCTRSAWRSFRNREQEEVKIYVFQRLPQAAGTVRCLILQTQMYLKTPLTARHLILRLSVCGENKGCTPWRKDWLWLVYMPQDISALGVQTNRNSLDKALARALFVKWRIEMRFAA